MARTAGGRMVAFTPQKTRTYEGIIKSLAMDAMGYRLAPAAPVRLDLEIGSPVPASWPLWKRQKALEGQIAPTGKPDADNVLKAVMDGCNGVTWADDVQVVEIGLRKFYSAQPGLRVTVKPLACSAAQLAARGA